jgi:hypothetical protein
MSTDGHKENITIIDQWIGGCDYYRLVNKGAGPGELQTVRHNEWVVEDPHFTHSVLCSRIQSLKKKR